MSKKLSSLYFQLSHLTDAGFALGSALDSVLDQASGKLRHRLQRAAFLIEKGIDPGEAFQKAGFHSLDIAMVKMAEKNGDYPGCFKKLAEHWEQRTQFKQKLFSSLAYPMFVALVAPLILKVPLLFSAGAPTFFQEVAFFYGSLLAIIVAIYLLHRSLSQSIPYHAFLNHIPVIGKIRFHFALARFYSALSSLLDAGVLIDQSWELACDATNNPVYRRRLLNVIPLVLKGVPLHQELAHQRAVPADHLQYIKTGEVSGKLPESTAKLSLLTLEQAQNSMALLAKILPVILFLLIAAKLAFDIISYYMSYFEQLNRLY